MNRSILLVASIRWSGRWYQGILLGLVGVLTSCVNLSAIREFAALSSDAAGYKSLTNDYIVSPQRQKLFQPDAMAAELEKQSKERQRQTPGLMALHEGVSKYMAALGELASDELVQSDAEVKGLTDALTKAKIQGVSSNAITAFGALTNVIAKAATDGYRQKHLKEMISSSNDSLNKVVGCLEFIVGGAYVESLQLELASLDKRYQTIVNEAAASGSQSASLYLVKKDVLERQEATNARIKACQVYVKTLTKIREGHQALNDNLGKVPTKEVIRQIKGYKKEAEALFKSVKELTKQ